MTLCKRQPETQVIRVWGQRTVTSKSEEGSRFQESFGVIAKNNLWEQQWYCQCLRRWILVQRQAQQVRWKEMHKLVVYVFLDSLTLKEAVIYVQSWGKLVKSLCWKQENWDIFIASQSAALKSSTSHSIGSCEVLLQDKQKPKQVLHTNIYLGNV